MVVPAGLQDVWRAAVNQREDVWWCALSGKVARFRELAPTAVDVQPGPKIAVNGALVVRLLFGDEYGALASRAAELNRFWYELHPDGSTDAPTFQAVAQSFLNDAYGAIIREGRTPEYPPDFYAMLAPAAVRGWPVYFLAVGTGLRLPAEAFRGKVALPSR